MSALIGQDLVRAVANPHTGCRGMSGDQVLRVLIVKQMNGYSYAALHFHLLDSVSYRTFCRFGALESVPSRSALAENLKKVRPGTLEQVNRMLVARAAGEGVERGRKVRIDATVVEANIHGPSDSSLLFDSARVLARLLGQAEEACGFSAWSDHTRRAKRRMRAIQNSRTKEKRRDLYLDLLKVSRKTLGYSAAAREALSASNSAQALRLRTEIEHYG
ncbi:MAG: transposase, partial [Gammaproteobacteria bacterium]